MGHHYYDGVTKQQLFGARVACVFPQGLSLYWAGVGCCSCSQPWPSSPSANNVTHQFCYVERSPLFCN